jgi:phage terminase large subunit
MSSFEHIEYLRKNPDAFFDQVLGAELETYQRQVIRAVASYGRVAVASAHNTGKSWLTARAVLWFGACFPHSKIITTGPTHNQVKNILWSEIRTAHAQSKIQLGGELNLTEWKLDSDWFALGFTPRNELIGEVGQGTQSSFQGFHAQGGILVVFDEATGIPHNIWTMAEGLLTQANTKFVAIGNPTSRNSEFFRCFKDPAWHKIYLSCFDSPNLIASGITDIKALKKELSILRTLPDVEVQKRLESYKVLKPWLLSTSWVMGRALKWGIDHPLFVSKVLGTFPEEGDNSLMRLGICEEAQRREYTPIQSDRKTLGVDVARFGTDRTVLTYLHGFKFVDKEVHAKHDTMQVSGDVIAFCRRHGWPDVICVDATGIGSGVVDALNQARGERIIPRTTEIREVQFGSGCEHDDDKAKYTNLKARMFDLLAQDLKAGLCLPQEDVYLDELPTILYAYDSKGRMAIESKDDYKKRTGRGSPDHADSLALANYGRHDEAHVGSFSSTLSRTAAPMAGSLNRRGSW